MQDVSVCNICRIFLSLVMLKRTPCQKMQLSSVGLNTEVCQYRAKSSANVQTKHMKGTMDTMDTMSTADSVFKPIS